MKAISIENPILRLLSTGGTAYFNDIGERGERCKGETNNRHGIWHKNSGFHRGFCPAASKWLPINTPVTALRPISANIYVRR